MNVTMLTAQDSHTRLMTFSLKAVNIWNAFSHCCSWFLWNSARLNVLDESKSTSEIVLPQPLFAPLAASHKLCTWTRQPCRTSLAKNKDLNNIPLEKGTDIQIDSQIDG